MALQWMILAYVVVAEVCLAIILTVPSPKAIQSRIASFVSRIVQPSLFIVPFAAFQLLDIYWKSEHRLKCIGEACTIADRLRSERAFFKAQRNVILCVSACFLYWCIYHICNYHKEIERLEEVEKRAKDE